MKFNEYFKEVDIERYNFMKEYIDSNYSDIEVDKEIMDEVLYGYMEYDKYDEPVEWLEKEIPNPKIWNRKRLKLIAEGCTLEQIELMKMPIMMFDMINVPTTQKERGNHLKEVRYTLTRFIEDLIPHYQVAANPRTSKLLEAISNELGIDVAFNVLVYYGYQTVNKPIKEVEHAGNSYRIPIDEKSHIWFSYEMEEEDGEPDGYYVHDYMEDEPDFI